MSPVLNYNLPEFVHPLPKLLGLSIAFLGERLDYANEITLGG